MIVRPRIGNVADMTGIRQFDMLTVLHRQRQFAHHVCRPANEIQRTGHEKRRHANFAKAIAEPNGQQRLDAAVIAVKRCAQDHVAHLFHLFRVGVPERIRKPTGGRDIGDTLNALGARFFEHGWPDGLVFRDEFHPAGRRDDRRHDPGEPKRQRDCCHPAEADPDHVGPLHPQLAPDTRDIVCQLFEGVGRGRGVRAAMPAGIEAQQPEIPTQRRDMVVPHGGVIGNAGDEGYPRRTLGAVDLDVDIDAVGFDKRHGRPSPVRQRLYWGRYSDNRWADKPPTQLSTFPGMPWQRPRRRQRRNGRRRFSRH